MKVGRVKLPDFPCGCVATAMHRKGGYSKVLPDKSRVCAHGHRWVMVWQMYRARKADRAQG